MCVPACVLNADQTQGVEGNDVEFDQSWTEGEYKDGKIADEPSDFEAEVSVGLLSVCPNLAVRRPARSLV